MDDICPISSSFKEVESNINELEDVASKFNLKIIVNETKQTRIDTFITKKQITQWQEVEEVDKLQCLDCLGN